MPKPSAASTGPTYSFQFAREWRLVDVYGVFRQYAQVHVFDGVERLAEAREGHRIARAGAWVDPGMVDPHVSALRVYAKGRILAEELEPSAELQSVEQPTLV